MINNILETILKLVNERRIEYFIVDRVSFTVIYSKDEEI